MDGDPDLEGYTAYVSGRAEIVCPDLEDDDEREIDLDLTEWDGDPDAEYGRQAAHMGRVRDDKVAGWLAELLSQPEVG